MIDRQGGLALGPDDVSKLAASLGPRPEKLAELPPHDSPREVSKEAGTLNKASEQVQWVATRMGWPNEATRPEIRERARNVIGAELAATRSSLEYMRNKWLVLYRLWRGETLARMRFAHGNVHVPEPYKAVETIVPRLFSALFEQEPWRKCVGRTRDDDPNAKTMDALLDYQVYETDLVRRAERMLRTLCIYGTAPSYTFWRQEWRKMQYRKVRVLPDPEVGEGAVKSVLEDVNREEVYKDHNDFATISVWDFFAPPLAGSVEEAEWCGHRALYHTGMVRRMFQQGLWTNWEEVEDSPGQDSASHDDEFKQRKAYSAGVWDPRAEMQTAGIGHYEVFERWGLFTLDEAEGPVECQIVALQPRSKCTIVRVSRNPYWHGRKPYAVPRYTIIDEELFGVGVIEPIARLSLEMDTKRALSLQGQHLAANPVLICGDDANVSDEQLILVPGLVLRAANAEGIKALVIPDVSDASIKGEMLCKADIRETTGAVTTMMGQSDEGSETATEIRGRLNESNVRIKGTIGNFEREWIVPVFSQWDMNNQQFMNTAKAIRILGVQGLKWPAMEVVTPEKIAGQFDHIALAGYRLTNMQVMTQHLVNMLDRAPALNMTWPGMINGPALLAKIMKEGFGFRDVADFIQMDPVDMPSAIEEQEAWLYGEVASVLPGENLMRHYSSHTEFVQTDHWQAFTRRRPDIAAKVNAHIAETGRKIAQMMEAQEMQMATAMQQLGVQGKSQGGGGGDAGGRGFADGGQDGESPAFRGGEDATKSEATSNSPNEGAS